MAAGCLGGVDPSELVWTLLLQFAAAASGCMVGVYCSAWSRTSTQAFFLTLAVMAGSFTILLVQASALGFSAGSALHPLLGVYQLYNADLNENLLPPLLISLLVTAIACRVLYSGAVNGLNAVALEPGSLIENVPTISERTYSRVAGQPHSHVIRFPMRSRFEAYPVLTAIARRELRVRFRLLEVEEALHRNARTWQRQFANAVLVCFIAWPVGAFVQEAGSQDAFILGFLQFTAFLLSLCWVFTGVAVIAGGILAAGCLTREKTRGTFRELLLSPIPSAQIVGGYVEGILWSLVGWIPVEWAVLAVALFAVPAPVIFGYVVFTFGVVLAAISIGLFFSWLAEHTTVAAAGTLAAILGWAVLTGAVEASVGSEVIPAAAGRSDILGVISRATLDPYPWGCTTSLVLSGLVQTAAALIILSLLIAFIHWQRSEDKSLLRLLLRLGS